ncbi:ubiquinol-cytochrome c reductase core subunit 1 [Vanrija albida]|uniref:Cytochrome b-c1 complex subunit 2, mitochondrial n=1 Tax=Vanrija albida TaxID=181172 RepID=A0ABR3Q9N7_9TREE
MSLLRLPRAAPALRRSYATAAASVAEASGVKVAGIENGSRAGTTTVTVAVKAGARYETTPGVAHVLKNFAFKSTASGSALRTARETELYGGLLSAGLSREHLFLTAEFLRGDEAHFLSLLASVLSSTQFLAHEYSELVLPTVQGDALAAAADPVTAALDAAHAVAFRRGLGNSLFAAAHTPVTLDAVKSYAQAAFAKSNIAVLGQGISTEALGAAVESAFGAGSPSAASSLSTPASAYYGGEIRLPLDTHANPTAKPTLVIAYGQAGAATPELQVLANVLGGESALKWAPGQTLLSLAASKTPGASARAVFTPYSDASLISVVVQAPTDEAVRAVAADVAAAIKATASGVKDEQLKSAVAKAKFDQATALETQGSLVAAATPALFAGSIPASNASFSALDGVSSSAVSKAAQALFSAKPTVVAVGNTHVLPYADELGL